MVKRRPPHPAALALNASNNVHVPGPRSCAPYSVARSRKSISITANATNETVILVGAFGPILVAGSSNTLVASPGLILTGTGGGAPATTGTMYDDPYFSGATTGTYEISRHAITTEIACTGTSGGLVPPGVVYAGVLAAPMDRSYYGSFNGMADSLTNRKGMKRYSSYELMSSPLSLSTYPLDAIKFSSFLHNKSASAADDEMDECVCPTVIIIPSTGGGAAYPMFTITVNVETRFRSGADGMLQSMHHSHRATPESVWSNIISAAGQTAGFIQRAGQAAYDNRDTISALYNAAGRMVARQPMIMDVGLA